MIRASLPDVMNSLSVELARLEGAIERLHDVVCRDVPGQGLDDAGHIRAIQSVDHTRQVLADLSGFLTQLAAEIPADWFLSLERPLTSLRLSELRHRLLPGGPATPSHETVASGECELF